MRFGRASCTKLAPIYAGATSANPLDEWDTDDQRWGRAGPASLAGGRSTRRRRCSPCSLRRNSKPFGSAGVSHLRRRFKQVLITEIKMRTYMRKLAWILHAFRWNFMQGTHASDCISLIRRWKITFSIYPPPAERRLLPSVSALASRPCIVDTISRADSSRVRLSLGDHKSYDTHLSASVIRAVRIVTQ